MTLNPSIKTKFLYGMAVMLLPIMLIALMSFYALRRNTESLGNLVTEVIEAIPQIDKVKGLIMMAQMPPNDYLISGNKAEQNTFGYYVQQIDDSLFELKHAPFARQKDVLLAELVQENWLEGKYLAQKIFAIKDPRSEQNTEKLMKKFDAELGKAVSLLNELEFKVFRDIELEKKNAEAWTYRLYLVISLSLAGGLAIASVAGLLLARMVLHPLRMLSLQAEKIGRGDHPDPIGLNGHDEFSLVMNTFNTMALNMQQKQAELRDMAVRDGLTGLLNRREFLRILAQELDRARRRSTEMSVMMLDIDHFKKINDTYGHQIGDDVLRCTAALFGRQIRAMDTVARYGGEEFIVITPESSEGALVIAKRILAAVAGQPFSDGKGDTFNVTISIGLASYPHHAVEANELVNKADMALYQAKDRGRNQICLAAGETITGLVIATALVSPGRQLASVKPKSVRERFKEKPLPPVPPGRSSENERCAVFRLMNSASSSLPALQQASDDLGL